MDLTNPTVIFGVRQFHVSNECSEAQEENNHPCAKKKKNRNKKKKKTLTSIQSLPTGLHPLIALMCLTATVKQELAPAKSWQKPFPGIHLYCQSPAQRFPSPFPGDTRARTGTQLGRSREQAPRVPTLQMESVFFSNISVKSVKWGTFFALLRLHSALKIDFLMMWRCSLAEVVNSLQHLRRDNVWQKTWCPQQPCPWAQACGLIEMV